MRTCNFSNSGWLNQCQLVGATIWIDHTAIPTINKTPPNKMITATAPKKQCRNHSSRLIALVFAFPLPSVEQIFRFGIYRLLFFGRQRIGINPTRRRVRDGGLVRVRWYRL
jgi:hypothetical protein